jgi:glycosyltransferase involved in cell wall biosynthesis
MQNRRRHIKRLSLRLLEMPVLRRAAAIHFTAEAEREEAIAAAAEIAKFHCVVIPLPVEVQEVTGAEIGKLAASPTADGNGGGPVILFLSRIDPKKGVELLLAAFRDVAWDFPDAELVVAGEGDHEYVRSLHAIAKELGVAERVRWVGFVAGAEKAEAFARAAIFVLPSYSENFGIAAAEALAAGVPSVLSENVAIAREARAADAAIVVTCDAVAIAAAMRHLLADSELCDRLRVNGQALVRERFSSEAVGRQLVDLYRSISR